MFYKTDKNEHGLKYDPYKCLIAPRPIGWISTLGKDGIPNIGPYSFFNGVSDKPHMVMFSSEGVKDSQRNAEETGEFVCNLASMMQRDEMNASAAIVPPDVNEFELAGLETEASELIKAPRIKGAPAHLECVYLQTVKLVARNGEHRYDMVIGEVVGIHIDDKFISEDGLVDTAAMQPLARLGYNQYSVVDEVWTMRRPRQK